MIDFNMPLRTTIARFPVRVLDRDYRSRGFGLCTLCAVRELDHDVLLLVGEDGRVHGHSTYAKIENTPSLTYIDMYEDGLLSKPRTTRVHITRKRRVVDYTLEINNVTGEVRRV